jgi:hypothetical protein
MGLEGLVIIEGLNSIADGINNNIENPILNGLAWLGFIVIFIYLVFYVWVFGAFVGHIKRFFWIWGIWAVLELANFIGGGHDSR